MKIFKLTLFLGIVGLISGLAMATTNSLTKDKIAQNKIDERDRSFQKSFPGKIETKDLDVQTKIIKSVYEISTDNKVVGYVYNIGPRGYGGEIDALISVSATGEILNFDVLAFSETPGIGAKIKDPEFNENMKTKTTEDEKIDYISGATISSRAIDGAFLEVSKHFNENYK